MYYVRAANLILETFYYVRAANLILEIFYYVGGSSHVSHMESDGSKRSEFTLCPMAYVRGLVICPLGAWRVVGVYMGMNVGCSASGKVTVGCDCQGAYLQIRTSLMKAQPH